MKLKEYFAKKKESDGAKGPDTMMERHDFLAKYIRPVQDRLRDDLVMLDNNMSVWTKNSSHEFSEGCRSCGEGTWLCIFVGPKCNLDCVYCPQGSKYQKDSAFDHARSFSSWWIDDTKLIVEGAPEDKIRGVSYSGGEPFLYLDKVVEMGNFVKEKKPKSYQWIYTNGVLADRDSMTRIYDAGIDEIRFHINATDFADRVMENMRTSRSIFPRVTVEIPVTEKVRTWLIDKGGLEILQRIGVEQLNLAELFYYTHDPRIELDPDRFYSFTQFPFPTLLAELESRVYTYQIIEAALNKNVDVLINDCSLERKLVQMLRRSLNPYLGFWRT